MSKLVRTLAVVVVALAAAAPAGATQPQALAIETNGHLTGAGSAAGTWTAAGAIADAGTYTETFRFAGQTIHFQKVLVGSLGTIVIEGRGVLEWLSPCTVTFRAGSWRIVEGTGAYEGLTGGGTPATTPESFGDVCTGVVHVAHAGEAHDG